MLNIVLLLAFGWQNASGTYAIFDCEADLSARISAGTDAQVLVSLRDFGHFLRRPAGWRAPTHEAGTQNWNPPVKNSVDPTGLIREKLRFLEADVIGGAAGKHPLLFARALCADDVNRAVEDVNRKRSLASQANERTDRQLGERFLVPRAFISGTTKAGVVLLNLAIAALPLTPNVPTTAYLAGAFSALTCNQIWFNLATRGRRNQALPRALDTLDKMRSDPINQDLFSYETNRLKLKPEWAAELVSGGGLSEVNRQDAFALNSSYINSWGFPVDNEGDRIGEYLVDQIVFKPRDADQPCWISTLRGPPKVAPRTRFLRD